jgi:hypothetical protein
MVTIVARSATNYERLLDEMKTASKLVQNMTMAIDRYTAKIAGLDMRTAVAILKLKNEMVSFADRSLRINEEILSQVESVKKDIADFMIKGVRVGEKNMFEDKKNNKEEVKSDLIVADSIDFERGNFSDYDIQRTGFFQTMTLNIVDRKLILTISLEPAPIAFVITCFVFVCAILLALIFAIYCLSRRVNICCKNRQVDELTTTTAITNKIDFNPSLPTIPAPTLPKETDDFGYEVMSYVPTVPPPPPPPFSKNTTPSTIPERPSTPKPIARKHSQSLSLGDIIPKMKSDGTARRPSEVADMRKKIPSTRPITKIVDGNVVTVGVLETAF